MYSDKQIHLYGHAPTIIIPIPPDRRQTTSNETKEEKRGFKYLALYGEKEDKKETREGGRFKYGRKKGHERNEKRR